MNVNSNVPWTPYYPYGPIWFFINWPLLVWGWTFIYQTEIYSMLSIITTILCLKRQFATATLYSGISILFIVSGQPYLLSSLSLVALGLVKPFFALLSIFDRLPLGTSFDFSHSGNWLEKTHLARYSIFGGWFIFDILYWLKLRPYFTKINTWIKT